jgi:transposase
VKGEARDGGPHPVPQYAEPALEPVSSLWRKAPGGRHWQQLEPLPAPLSAPYKQEPLPMKTTEPTLYLGLDVSKHKLDLGGLEKPKTYANTAEGIAQLLESLPAKAHLVLEASGGYEQATLKACWQTGRAISRVNARYVRDYARSQGQKAKSDPIDAQVLADYGRERRPEPTPQPSPALEKLKEQLHAREHLLELQRKEQNHQEHAPETELVKKQSQARLELISEQLKELEKSIKQTVKEDPELKQRVERLEQIDGIGKVTAWTICAELPEAGTLEKGQPAALAGLAPYDQDSGQKRGRRQTEAGRSRLRRVLYMAALTASQHNTVLKAKYAKMKESGKATKVILTAIARKLIELANRVLKNPNFKLAP